MDQLTDYSVRLAPGIVLIAVTIALTGRRARALRTALLVAGFVLIRDLMTPFGFWTFGRTPEGLPWLRFTDDSALLVAFGLGSVLLTLLVLRLQPDLAATVVWGRLDARAVLTALVGLAVLAVPLVLIMRLVDLGDRGGPVGLSLLPALAVLTLGGNFLEEVLFRGFVQGQLTHRVVPLSGLVFAAGHVFLATTVTDLGWPVLAFTLAEGLVCAEVRRHTGVLASTLTHGLLILTIACGV